MLCVLLGVFLFSKVYKIKIKISCMYSSNKQKFKRYNWQTHNSTEDLHLPPYFVLSTLKLYAL